MSDTGEFPTYEPGTPQRVSLGEVYRGQRRLEKQFTRLDQKLEIIFEKNIPSRVRDLEVWRDWTIRVITGTVIVGILSLLFATGGAV